MPIGVVDDVRRAGGRRSLYRAMMPVPVPRYMRSLWNARRCALRGSASSAHVTNAAGPFFTRRSVRPDSSTIAVSSLIVMLDCFVVGFVGVYR
jgi:hypothetical protein